MSKLIKVSTVNKNDVDLEIDYLLTFRCNYDCSYCISHDVNHPSLQKSSEEIIEAFNFIFKQYINKKIKLRILGGEPFVYKHFINLVNRLSNYNFLKIIIITNLSVVEKTLEKLKESKNILIAASYHPEYSNNRDFVNKIKYLQNKGFKTYCSVSIHPDEKYLKTSTYVLENITENIYPKFLSIQPKSNINIYGKSYEYSKTIKDTVKKYNESGLVNNNLKYEYADKTSKIFSMSDVMLNNRDNFKGLLCKAGHDKLHINEEGDIFPAACFLNSRVILGNMFKKTFKKPTSYVTCPFTSCKCTSDLALTKFKNDKLVA
tara:strand:+ start:847 stop:1800 length:954 start_codon:yes stop_codon:yes gene_type:complete